MALLTPPPTTAKFFRKLHYHHHPTCAPSTIFIDQHSIPPPKTTITTTNHRRKSQLFRTRSTTMESQLKPELELEPQLELESESELKLSEVKSSELKLESGGEGRILSADTMITRLREMYRGRNGNKVDKVTLGLLVTIHLLSVFAPFTFTWGALWLTIGLYTVTYLGITLSYHRNLSHKTFKIPKWLEYAFAYCGAQALQGSPIDWVSTHRYHHQYCDSERDPHTPIKGFWHSYIKWMLDTENVAKMTELPNNVRDLEKQPFYRFLRTTYFLHPLGLGFVLYAIGGFPFVVWGIGVRTVCSYHMTWLVNSVCHGRGVRVWDTDDISVNIWWLGILAFGAGWHNNHHAFEYSARHGLEWWQIDFTWYVIRLLEITGLATDIKLPTPMDMQRKALPSKIY
ncbi:palmitoyl-monogalactosyldiacylglycerol delta-7 desaturase, chloroplastic-like [Cynara cardunculus var. scolymus]|uniref:palmitoyl-monogalactosyldiacylglycerol delta-7 desaturase, chloroplastic-like n=1 Tax=Cynara cardunculus var. scolymus TaxID=59895 RepID=UPI000D6289A5|nr:palmitoyl-monogalactosyldiacylglycerol delta-7 desaturase, chloroplastic-like [Cynara cardunculus var. scolymus]